MLAWLSIDQAPDLAKDAQRFPGLMLPWLTCEHHWSYFLDDIVWSDASVSANCSCSDEAF
jgi:hypothetical protein